MRWWWWWKNVIRKSFYFKQHEKETWIRTQYSFLLYFYLSSFFPSSFVSCVRASNRVVNHHFGRLMWVSGFFLFLLFAHFFFVVILSRSLSRSNSVVMPILSHSFSFIIIILSICSVNFISLNVLLLDSYNQFISYNTDNKHLLIERSIKRSRF